MHEFKTTAALAIFVACLALAPEAKAFEFYAGLNSSYMYETPPGAAQGVEIGNGSAFNWMAEVGINFYRWGLFASAGYRQTLLQLTDSPEVSGTAYSSKLGFQNLFEANVGAKVLVLPYRSWSQLYVSGGISFAPQNVQLLLYNRLVEQSFVPRFGAFAQAEYTINWYRRFYIGAFAGVRYLMGAWGMKQPHRFPTSSHTIAFQAGLRGGVLFGQIK